MPYFITILNFEAAILDISELYVYDVLHIAFLDYLNKIGHFDSLRYGFGLYKCHSQYSKWRPSWNSIWRPYGTFFSLAPILKRFSAFFSFRVPNFMLCSQSPRFFHQSAQVYQQWNNFTVRSGTRPDLPDFAVLGILVWAMTLQGHRTICKWCSPALNGYSFSRQMFMAKENGGSRRAKRRSNTSGAWKSLRVLSPFRSDRILWKGRRLKVRLKNFI